MLSLRNVLKLTQVIELISNFELTTNHHDILRNNCSNVEQNQEDYILGMQNRLLRRQNLSRAVDSLMVCKLFVKLEEIMNLLIYDFLGLEQISDNKRRSLSL